jgi:Predicted O-linked N-acetylglucosamine transferase, SPINDLY family
VLTIGFLCNAPAGQDQRAMIAAIARGFDRASVRVIGFGPGELGEAVNLPYRGSFAAWRNTNKVDELTLSAMIRGEGIDVLVDCDGLAARERLSLLARNAAPRQYSWLNVPLGVPVPGAQGHLGAEAGPSCGMLLLPCADGKPTPLPAGLAEGRVTFGADVALAELNPELVRVWSAILHAVPESVLVLADRGFSEPDATNRLVEMFGNFGVAHRIDVAAGGRAEDFFADVDIALAPFPVVRPAPYGLCLSSGVPVVALSGRDTTGFARSLTVLGEAAGRLVAADTGQYVVQAVSLAGDLDYLAEFRKAMPLQLRQSVVFSPRAFAAEWERFFREKLAAEA